MNARVKDSDTAARYPIPRATIQQNIIVLGKTGAGKSSAARTIVEAMLDEQLPVCIIDPKGDWWGIKLSADGKRAGYPLVIFGGRHADVPINSKSGAHVAELFAEGNRPCVIDLRGWMPAERSQFFIDFASTLFQKNVGRRWLVPDEVHNFAPKGKVLDPLAGKCLHWANRLASEGRGLGINMIGMSQRPQKVHNDFLTSCETLIALRVLHASDREAYRDWIDGCGDPEAGKEMLRTIANLKRGTGWVWSPEIEFGPELVNFPLFRTYDSFKPQEASDAAKLTGWADVNLDDVKAKFASVIEEHKANDPEELKKQIRELEERLENREDSTSDVDLDALQKEAWDDGHATGLDVANGLRADVVDRLERLGSDVGDSLVRMGNAVGTMIGDLRTHLGTFEIQPASPVAMNKPAEVRRTFPPSSETKKLIKGFERVHQRETSGVGAGSVDKPMPRAFLTALAQYPEGLSKSRLLVLADYRSSGPVSTCFAEIARNGWTEQGGPGIRITSAGRKALGRFDPLPTGAKLREYVLNGSKLSTMEKAMMRVLFKAHPSAVKKGKILEETGYKSSGPVSSAFAKLVAIGYADKVGSGELRASKDFY